MDRARVRSAVWREMRGPAALLVAAGGGVFLSWRWPEGAPVAERALSPLLIVVLFALCVRLSLERVREAARDWRYAAVVGVLNFGLAPGVAALLARLLPPDVPELRVGLFLALLTPCTDWYLIFTHLVGGDVARNLAILPQNLILQLALLPLYVWLFTSAWVPVEIESVGRAVLFYVGLPLLVAQGVRRRWGEQVVPSWLGIVALVLVVLAMFYSHGHQVLPRPELFVRLAPPMLLFYVIALGASGIAARALDYPRERFLALACTTMARNSPLVLPLALVLFPDHPLVALSQLVEPLVEIPSLLLFALIVRGRAALVGEGASPSVPRARSC